MITQIKISHFFSFGEKETISLNSETNILVGINGSGKSNFIKTFQLLYEGVLGKDGLESLINKSWGGLTSILNCNEENLDTITISYEFDKNIVKSVLNNKGHNFPTYLNVENGRGVISKGEKKNARIQPAIFNENELTLKQISEPDSFFPLFTLKKAIEEIAVYSYFDTTIGSPIRGLCPYYSETKLLSNGENLAHLLNFISINHTKNFDTIISLLQRVNPNFRDLAFAQPTASKTLLTLKEKNLNRAITVEHISDGTLRFLILLAILYNPT